MHATNHSLVLGQRVIDLCDAGHHAVTGEFLGTKQTGKKTPLVLDRRPLNDPDSINRRGNNLKSSQEPLPHGVLNRL